MNLIQKMNTSIDNKQSGMSLIEVMVSVLIGLILTGGAIHIFISNNATYRLESELSRMQEGGRFIIDKMAKELRMAGYFGCSSRSNVNTNVISNNPPPLSATEDAIQGYEASGGSWSPTIPTDLMTAMTDIDGDTSRDLIVGTDVVVIQRASECGASVQEVDVMNANIKVRRPNTCGFQQDQTVIVSNCRNADVFSITNVQQSQSNRETLAHSNSGNSTNKLSQAYGPDAQAYVFHSNIFFLAPGDDGRPALHMAIWNPVNANDFDVLELAGGVQNLQILYGVDNAGGDEYADAYLTANNVTDWDEVRSVRFNVLLQSADNMTIEPRSFTFNGVNANTSNDRRLRMAFSSTVSIRNRLQ